MAGQPPQRQCRPSLWNGRSAVRRCCCSQDRRGVSDFRPGGIEAACRAPGRRMNKKPLPPEITAALTADPLLVIARDLGQIDDADYKSLDEQQRQRTGDQKGSERWLKQDRARVAGEQDYEVRYEAKKTGKSK